MPSPTPIKSNTQQNPMNSNNNNNNNNTDTTVSSPTSAPSSTSPSKSIFDKISSRISTSGNNHQHSSSNSSQEGGVKRGFSMRFSKAIGGSRVLFRPNEDFSSLGATSNNVDQESRAQKTRSVSIMVPNYDLAEKQGIPRQAILESERVTNFKLQMKKRKQKGASQSFSHLITKRTTPSRRGEDSTLVECK